MKLQRNGAHITERGELRTPIKYGQTMLDIGNARQSATGRLEAIRTGGKRSQVKGRAGELELCRLLQEYGYPVQPGEAVSYGSTPDLTGLTGIHIECKRGEKQALYEWIQQAQRDSSKFRDGLPAIFWRKNRAPWLVCMTLTDWISLYNRTLSEKDGKGRSDDT